MGLWENIMDLVLPNPHTDMAFMNLRFLRIIQAMRLLALEVVRRNFPKECLSEN